MGAANATVPIPEDELSMNTGSTRPSPSVQSLSAVNAPRWIGNSIQTLIMKSIDWKELRDTVRDDIMGVVSKYMLKDDVRTIIEKQVIKYMDVENVDLDNIPTGGVIDREKLNKKVCKSAKLAIFKTICFESLSNKIIEQIMNAMDFESLKVRAMEKILRNAATVSRLEKLMVCVGRNNYESREKGVESTKRVELIKRRNYASASTSQKEPKRSRVTT